MVVRVAEQAQRSGAERILVATDCHEIAKACEHYGVQAAMTRADHPSGTDRIAQVAEQLQASPDQIIVNVQGDEPLIDPELITQAANSLHHDPDASVSTAATPIESLHDAQSPNVVKVVCDHAGRALYFSRAPIPWHRDAWTNLSSVSSLSKTPLLRHIGLYGFRAKALVAFAQWPACELEKIEALEQLRWLWMGHHITVHISPKCPHPGVDTADDLARVRAIWAQQHS